jgi:hypothetical protein
MTPTLIDTENKFKLYQLTLDQATMIEQCEQAIERFHIFFGDESPTWHYRVYNTFCLTAGMDNFYKLYKDLIAIIKDYHQINEPLWFQSWINYHMPTEVLDWHDHTESVFHGYISLRPQNTKTVFRNFEVVNKVGLLYIGDVGKEHCVEVLEPYTDPRITIAFDVFTEKNMKELINKFGSDINLSLIPI